MTKCCYSYNSMCSCTLGCMPVCYHVGRAKVGLCLQLVFRSTCRALTRACPNMGTPCFRTFGPGTRTWPVFAQGGAGNNPYLPSFRVECTSPAMAGRSINNPCGPHTLERPHAPPQAFRGDHTGPWRPRCCMLLPGARASPCQTHGGRTYPSVPHHSRSQEAWGVGGGGRHVLERQYTVGGGGVPPPGPPSPPP